MSDALIPVPDYLIRGEVQSERDRTRGDRAAKQSVQSNIGEDKVFNFSSILWGSDREDYRTLYYEVTLEENVKHLFLGDLDPMPTKATAVAKITHYMEGPNLFDQTLAIAEAQTYKTWDHIKVAKANDKDKADSRSVLSTGNRHKDGDNYRTETLHITGLGGINDSKYGNPYKTKGKTDQSGYDDLFVDWQGDMSKMETDLDLNIENSKSNLSEWSRKFEDNKDITTVDTYKYALKYRIHGNINVDKDENGKFPYPVRDADFFKNNKKALDELKRIYDEGEGKLVDEDGNTLSDEEFIKRVAKEPPDPLYARIESEPVHDGKGLNPDGSPIVGEKASSVHQIIINLNVSNATETYTSGEFAGEYSDRPIFFYYTGPEKVNENSHVRDSLPVIINFNADFRGIFFFPNSPVVINGNNKDFYGYVIAKEYVMLKDEKEYFYDYENDVYYAYDKNILLDSVDGMPKIKDSDDYQQVTIEGISKYIRKSDLENLNLSQYETPPDSEFTSINNFWYNVNDAKTAEDWAYATGNGKVKYYYTLRKKKNEDWIYEGEGYFDRTNGKVFQTFGSNWNYNNDGNDTNDTGKKNGQGVWRVKEILPDGTEGAWLDETDEYKNKFLLKVKDVYTPAYFYSTPEELLTAMGGYTKIEGTDYWKTNNALSYVKFETDGKTYYIPSTVTTPKTYDGDDPLNVAKVKYYEDNEWKEGYADLSSEPEKYYKIYQRDDNGNDTTLNPMFIDSLGNVQYKMQKNADGTDKKTNDDGSVAYETIKPTMGLDDFRGLDKSLILETGDIFEEMYGYLANEIYFNKDDFKLNKSEFDGFYLVRMTRYSHLNKQGDNRSIENFFTSAGKDELASSRHVD